MKRRPHQTDSTRAGVRRKAVRRQSPWKAWLADRAPILLFCGRFFGLLMLFYFLFYLPVSRRALDVSTLYYARFAGAILGRLGEGVRCAGSTISSPAFALTVLPSCSAFEFPLFFAALVIAFPSPIRPKIIGILAGTGFFLILNLLRITSLFLIGVHLPKVFTLAHERYWGTILICAIVALSFYWIKWAAPYPQNDPATA